MLEYLVSIVAGSSVKKHLKSIFLFAKKNLNKFAKMSQNTKDDDDDIKLIFLKFSFSSFIIFK